MSSGVSNASGLADASGSAGIGLRDASGSASGSASASCKVPDVSGNQPENTIVPVLPVQPQQPRSFKFHEIDMSIQTTYNLVNSNSSTILDIIAVYVKGQKILYTEAKTLCEQRLNKLMLPAIFNTAVCTVLSLVLKDFDWGATVVSVLNGINAFILALINYLKLDAKAEAHRTTAYKFDKLQANLEFNSGKELFMPKDVSSVAVSSISSIIEATEKAIQEIKETNQFILPENIRYLFPKLHNTNVFAEVKKIQNREMLIVNQLKDLMNEKEIVSHRVVLAGTAATAEDRELLADLERRCKALVNHFILIKDDYLMIDQDFEGEMRMARQVVKRCQPCGWLKS